MLCNNLGSTTRGSNNFFTVSNPEAPHVLDLVHYFVNSKKKVESENVESPDNHVVGIIEKNKLKLKLKRCASRLVAAGLGNMLVVTNEIDKQVDEMADEEARGFDFEFKFEKGKLEIAELHITKTTKAKWRNVIAWEHHKKNWKSTSMVSGYESGDENLVSTSSPSGKFTLSSLIFDDLICCADDVKLLKEKNIIVDHLKMTDDELEEYFHTMSFGVDRGVVDSSYVKMVDELNNYSEAFFVLRILKILWHLFKFLLEWLVNFLKQDYNFVAALVAYVLICTI
ncbi:hypothetical protein TSUD_161540 [Trifolium subterraneum]|uniref:Uncharacterized protein n=1 Tax=Trifolium subterraneum TaxID=3900 RepID=A0A2Z6M7L2_TRISU|nr:hypothetical protein TSUD_161540 [Trifolium subterraneum]